MRITVIIILAISFSYNVQAQYVGGDPGRGTQMNTKSGGIVQELGLPTPKTVGNSYLNEDWYIGNIVLTNDKIIKRLPIRYDLNNNGLEIKAQDEVKFLSCTRIDKFNFSILNDVKNYINPRPLIKLNHDIPNVFLEVIESGGWNLYKQTTAILREGNYNAALDMGDRDNKIVKSAKYIIANDKRALFVGKSRKKLSKEFSNQEEVFSFLKENKLKLNNEDHLKKLVRFLNAH